MYHKTHKLGVSSIIMYRCFNVVWDTAGQEKFKTLPSNYFRGVQGIILVYDITEGETFQRVENWLEQIELNHKCDELMIMLVGNKVDLAETREVKV